MASITLTAEQTETYDAGGEAADLLMRDLRARAEDLSRARAAGRREGPAVEIYTADGVTLAAISWVREEVES